MNNFKQPTTKLEDIVEFYKSKKSEINTFYARIESNNESLIKTNIKQQLINNKKILDHYIKRIKEINNEYKTKLNTEDQYDFNNINQLEEFLINNQLFDKNKIKLIINHEKQHVNKAKELNYHIIGFTCWLGINKDNKLDYAILTRINAITDQNNFMKKEDYKKISLAPDKPSFLDSYQ